MKDIFVADAHLLAPEAENYRKFLQFLQQLEGSTRTLYLLGDIFQFWVGYRHCVFTSYVPLLEALYRLKQAGTRLVFVEGNHDFFLGPYFRDTLACEIFPETGVVEIDGQKVHLAHGDLMDPNDRGYRLLRATLRSRPARLFKRLISADAMWGISVWMNRKSQAQHPNREGRIDKQQLITGYAREQFARGCSAVVTGHHHTPLQINHAQGTIIALGDWISQYSYAVYADGQFSLTSF
jgi:UDP-2,3-diacylglucosamine hydrolase